VPASRARVHGGGVYAARRRAAGTLNPRGEA
jgi:hypothetical protein